MTRLGSGYSPALDKAMGWDLPDYNADQHVWTERMKGRMSGRMMSYGIALNNTRDRIIKMVLVLANERGVMGDERKTWRCFVRVWRDYLHEKKETALETLLADGAARGMTEDEIYGILRTARADNGGKLNFRDLRDRDKYGQAFQKFALEKQKAIDAQNEQSRREFAAITEDRDVITDAMIDEHELNPDKIVFALPAHLAKSFGNTAGLHVRKIFDGAIDTWLSTHNNDTRLAWRLTLQYELKNGPIENAPESPDLEPSAIPVQGSPSNAPEAAPVSVENLKQKENVEVTQHLLKVYPVNFGSTYYKGVKFSVTLCSADATWADAVTLMDEFVAHKECIAPDCFVAPSNVTPMVQQQTAPTQPSATPAVQGNKPVQSEQIVKVQREFDQKGKFEYTGLYVTMGNAPSKFAVYKIKDGTPHAAKVNAITGVDWPSAKLGVEAPGGFIAFYTDSDNMNASGKPYHDLVDVSVTLERTA